MLPSAAQLLEAMRSPSGPPSTQRALKIGTVDPAFTTGLPKVTFDGESTMSTKTYAYLNSKPAAGARVVLAPVGTGYVIIGTIGGTSGGGSRFAIKSADESVTNSITLQDDNHLTLPVDANSTYTFQLLLFVVSATNNTGHFKYTMAGPAGSSVDYVQSAPNRSSLTTGSAATGEWRGIQAPSTSTNALGASTTATGHIIWGTVVTGATAGNLTLQWAQATADAAATTIKIRSWMKIDRVA